MNFPARARARPIAIFLCLGSLGACQARSARDGTGLLALPGTPVLTKARANAFRPFAVTPWLERPTLFVVDALSLCAPACWDETPRVETVVVPRVVGRRQDGSGIPGALLLFGVPSVESAGALVNALNRALVLGPDAGVAFDLTDAEARLGRIRFSSKQVDGGYALDPSVWSADLLFTDPELEDREKALANFRSLGVTRLPAGKLIVVVDFVTPMTVRRYRRSPRAPEGEGASAAASLALNLLAVP